jgi:pimeloyl-ACP methyl ester carboxylesterase
MNNTSLLNDPALQKVNYVQKGTGAPVIMIHGLAASLHDWDELLPDLAGRGYSAYALDLLGHGDSGKPASRAYKLDWLFDHLSAWIDSLTLTELPILIGHSLGGYLTLEYARRFPARTRGLVLVDPFFHVHQLPAMLRGTYRNPEINMLMMERTPEWLFRMVVDATSLSMGQRGGGGHNLPKQVRMQTAMDYKRTAPGTYNLPSETADMRPHLANIPHKTLVVWGERDNTLTPASFKELVTGLPNAQGRSLKSGHVPHQSHAAEFNQMVVEFLATL